MEAVRVQDGRSSVYIPADATPCAKGAAPPTSSGRAVRRRVQTEPTNPKDPSNS